MEELICDICNVITTIEANGKKLIVFYNKTENGLFYQFSFRKKKHKKIWNILLSRTHRKFIKTS